MPSFVVDPILCTTPESNAEPNDVRRWLTALEGWLVALEGSPFAWRHFLSCTSALVEVGRFPEFDSLRAAVRRTGADINVAALLHRITRFFQDDARDLQIISVTKCVLPKGEPIIAPPELITRNLPEIRGPLQDSLLNLACDKVRNEAFAKEARLVTSPFRDGAKEISIAGTVDEIEPDSPVTQLKGQAFAARFPCLSLPGALFEFNREALRAGGEAGFCALVTSIATSTYPGSQPFASSVGSQFWRSLNKSGILEDAFASGKLLDVNSAALADKLKEANVGRRSINESGTSSGTQKMRDSDKAKAWRLTITKPGAGYRLHYWHIPARGDEQPEQIEFANVLCERDPVVIPEE